MNKLTPHYPNVQGVQINSDGSPNTRALGNMIIALMVQLNSLADDINAIRTQLNTIQADVSRPSAIPKRG